MINFDNSLITDKYDNNQIEGFKSNRHDQSIFSLISKLSGYMNKARYPDEGDAEIRHFPSEVGRAH